MGRHEETYAVPHKAGLVPHTVNLNKDSTHPKPWRPPTDWDHLLRIYDPYPIFTKTGPQFFKRKHNWIEDDPFMTNLAYSAKKGFGFGKTCPLSKRQAILSVRRLSHHYY